MPLQAPSIGEKFPEIQVPTTHGVIKLPDYFKGKWFVFFSHPADFTPVCTTEFVSFARRYDDFKKLNTELIGLSVDSNFSHIKWIEWIEQRLGQKIPFPIIADPTGEVAQKLGLLHAQSATATVRAVFVVDPEATVRAIVYYPLEVGRNIDEILRLVEILQLSTKYGRAVPANWPFNELIGDNLIVPPASSIREAEERLKQYKCYDWWFCYEDKATLEEKELAKKFLKRAAQTE